MLEAGISMEGNILLFESLRSSCNSMLPVPLNSSKMTSSIFDPVSVRAVARIVSDPPFSMLRAAPKNLFGLCRALESTPPESTFPDAGAVVLKALASRVIESSRITTSWPHSTSRLAFSRTILATRQCRSAGSSKVEAITSAFTFLAISVTSSGLSSISNIIR